MSCTLAAPPGTPAATRSISSAVNSISGSISTRMASQPGGICVHGTRCECEGGEAGPNTPLETLAAHALGQRQRQQGVAAEREEVVLPSRPVQREIRTLVSPLTLAQLAVAADAAVPVIEV